MKLTLRTFAPGSLLIALGWLAFSAPLSCANSTPQPPPPVADAGHHTHKDGSTMGGGCGAIGQRCCAPPTPCNLGGFCAMEGICKDQHPPDIGLPCASNSTCSSGICGYTQGISDGSAPVPDGNGTPTPQTTGCTVGCAMTSECTPGWNCQQLTLGQGTCVCTWAPEICDGLDNNCDGIIDNEPEVDNYCTSMMEGIPQHCVEGGVDGGPTGGAHCECTDLCAGTCVNFQTDNMNCGKCGNACKPMVEKCQGGSCGCAFTLCGTDCVNTGGTDKNNCGDCGKVCDYTCTAGNCTPSVLASGYSSTASIGVDSANVYWVDESTAFKTEVHYCPITGCVGAPALLGTSLAGGSLGREGIAVTSSNVYFADDSSSVYVVPIATPPATVFSAKNAGYQTFLATDSVNLYWANSSLDTIYSCALGTTCTTPTLVASTGTVGAPSGLAVSGANVYFGTFSAVYTAPVSGGSVPTKLCMFSGFSSIAGLLVAGSNVYFTDGFTAVYVCPLTGGTGTATSYATGTSPTALATDGVNIYWAEGSGLSGTIKKCALGTSCATPTTVVNTLTAVNSMAVGAKDIFWTTYGTTLMGAVLRYSK